MNRKQIVIFCVLIIVAVIAYKNISVAPMTYNVPVKTSDPHVNPSNGWYIPFNYQGAFKDTKTGKIFQYSHNDDHVLAQCLDTNCSTICFFADWNGKIDQPSAEDTCDNQDAAIRGKVTKVVAEGNTANGNLAASYTIAYPYNGIQATHITEKENLCSAAKGGGFNCLGPETVGQPVNVWVANGGVTSVSFQNLVRGEVLNLQESVSGKVLRSK